MSPQYPKKEVTQIWQPPGNYDAGMVHIHEEGDRWLAHCPVCANLNACFWDVFDEWLLEHGIEPQPVQTLPCVDCGAEVFVIHRKKG